jgi:hypothetical protein
MRLNFKLKIEAVVTLQPHFLIGKNNDQLGWLESPRPLTRNKSVYALVSTQTAAVLHIQWNQLTLKKEC